MIKTIINHKKSSENQNATSVISYKNIISVENLKKGLEKTKGNVAPGLDGVVKSNISDKQILALHKSLKSQRFTPTPVKRIYIPKPDGGQRPLGLASQKDKVVQAAILLLLEPVLEKVFLDVSYGCRPKRNCHTALKKIKSRWQNVTWVISIDIRKYFDTINHDLLLNMLKDYCDQATIELIRKFIKCGYIDFYNNPEKLEESEIGTPQGSLISPILSNLYLHLLDCFIVEQLLKEWNRGSERKFVSGYQTRKNLTLEEKKLVEAVKIPGIEEAIGRLKHNEWVKTGLPARDSKDDNFRRLYYARYVDDFIIGFNGTKAEAEQIKSQIVSFLWDKLKLQTNDTKSFIKHSSEKGIKYLGYYLRYIFNNKIVNDSSKKQGVQQLKSIAINRVQLRIPVELILRRAVDRGYGKIRKNGTIRPSSCRKLGSLDDKLIVQRFSAIIRGLMEFYSPANQRSDLWQIVAFYRKSCALTLADKHKYKTAAKVYKIYGPNLKVSDPIKKKETVFFYPTTLKTTGNFKLGKSNITLSDSVLDPIQGSYKKNIKTSKSCQWPGCNQSTDLQEHHVNPVRNIKGKHLSDMETWLRKNQRKTVTLCREHHQEAENAYRLK
jgi:group II intron reverse transcriptase/maturase